MSASAEQTQGMQDLYRIGIIGNILRKEVNPASYPFSLDSDFEFLLKWAEAQGLEPHYIENFKELWKQAGYLFGCTSSTLSRDILRNLYRLAEWLTRLNQERKNVSLYYAMEKPK